MYENLALITRDSREEAALVAQLQIGGNNLKRYQNTANLLMEDTRIYEQQLRALFTSLKKSTPSMY